MSPGSLDAHEAGRQAWPPADRTWGWVMGRVVGPSHMSMEPGSAGSKVRGTQAASSSIRRTPKEYS